MRTGLELPTDSTLELSSLRAIVEAGADVHERLALLERLRQQQQAALADLEWRSREFERLYARAAVTPDFAEIVHLHEIVREKGRAAVELVAPGVEKIRAILESPLVKNNREGERLYKSALDIGLAWVGLYKTLEKKLSDLMDKRVDSEVLRACPMQGEVDHDALSREFMVRFPKLRAALAK